MSNQENISTEFNIPDDYKDILSNINDFVNMANDSELLTCDAECQRNKSEEQVYENYIIEQNNLLNAPGMFQEAEKKYIIMTKGDQYYNNMKNNEFKKDADTIVEKMNDKIIDLYIDISSKIEDDELFNDSLKNTKELANSYSKRIADLETDIANNENKANIANRTSYYNNKHINSWCSTNYYLKIFFWFIFVGYFLISLVYKQYEKKYVKLVLILVPLFASFQGHYLYLLILGIIRSILIKIPFLARFV